MSHLNAFIKYGDDNKVVPMSLVKMTTFPRMRGNWKSVHNLCCDPDYVPFLSYTKKKAYLQLNHKGEVVSGPIIRNSLPKNGRFIQVPYNLCCDVNMALEITITSPLTDTTVTEGDPITLTVTTTGSTPVYVWLKDGEILPGEDTNSLSIPVSAETDAGEYEVRVYDIEGHLWATSTATVTVTPIP